MKKKEEVGGSFLSKGHLEYRCEIRTKEILVVQKEVVYSLGATSSKEKVLRPVEQPMSTMFVGVPAGSLSMAFILAW